MPLFISWAGRNLAVFAGTWRVRSFREARGFGGRRADRAESRCAASRAYRRCRGCPSSTGRSGRAARRSMRHFPPREPLGLMCQRIRPFKVARSGQVGHEFFMLDTTGSPLKRMESPTLCFGGHHVLRRNQPRWWMATANTQIIAERGISSIRCAHHLAGAVAFDFPC
jgi:hypothetical protein